MRRPLHGQSFRMLGALMPVWCIGSLVLVAVRAIAGCHHDVVGLVVITAAFTLLVAALT